MPAGVAHGYYAEEENTLTLYLKGGRYDPATDKTINPFCSEISIQWPISKEQAIVSAKDLEAPSFSAVCGKTVSCLLF